MATLKEEIVARIKPCCRNRACAEQAADVAIEMVKEKLKIPFAYQFIEMVQATVPKPLTTREKGLLGNGFLALKRHNEELWYNEV